MILDAYAISIGDGGPRIELDLRIPLPSLSPDQARDLARQIEAIANFADRSDFPSHGERRPLSQLLQAINPDPPDL